MLEAGSKVPESLGGQAMCKQVGCSARRPRDAVLRSCKGEDTRSP